MGMTKQEIKDKIIFELDIYNCIGGSDNPFLFTFEANLLFYLSEIFTDEDKERLHNAIIHFQTKQKGLFNRIPYNDQRTEHHDNYVAYAAMALFGFKEYAERIDDYGKKHWYCYNNVPPNQFSISRLRQPFDIFYYRVAANRSLKILGLIGYIHFIGALLMNFVQSKDNTSGKLLDWIRLEVMKHKWYVKPCVWLFNAMLKSKYENGMEDVIKVYHFNNVEFQTLAKGIKYIL